MDIQLLIESSHSLGKDQGFWEKDKDLREEILYIISNVGDIAKAFKKNKRADWESYERLRFVAEHNESDEELKKTSKYLFKTYIKDSFEDEITNVILRVTDLVGGKNIDIVQANPWIENLTSTDINYFFRTAKPTEEFNGNVAHWLNEALSLCLFSSDKDKDFGLFHIIFHLGSLIEYYDIDIEKHLTKKIEFNRSRPLLYKTE